jgi:molecular chaperone DnaK
VLTVPACFDAPARRAVLQAGRIAGIAVSRVLNEPTAAARAYQHHVPVGATALVFALGGGATDVSVLRRDENGLQVLATRGDRELGAREWDDALLQLVDDRRRDRGEPSLLRDGGDEALLRAEVDQAKRALSAAGRVVLRVGSPAHPMAVTRQDFERVTESLLARARRLLEAGLSAVALTPADIDVVLPVGGPTRMPMVRRMLHELFGHRLVDGPAPEETVALGAALLGRVDPATAVREVASYGLGVLARDPATGVQRG